MYKRLQNNERSSRGIVETIWTNEVILNNEYSKKAIEIIRQAQSEILICAYAWRWYEKEPETDIQKINVEIVRAKRRGVRIRALVDNSKILQLIKKQDINCRYVGNERMLHAKAICIDEKTLIIGSHNLTKRAIQENIEISIKTNDLEPILQFKTYFEKIWTVANES